MKEHENELTLRRSAPGDEPALKRLWQAVFGDTDEFIDAFFQLLYSPGTACVALSGDRVVSAGHCLPGVTAKGKKCAYIYAVATDPDFRGLGAARRIVRNLTDQAFSEGTDVVATLPASESLTGWYKRVLGMEPVFRKGLPGAVFPESWHRFAGIVGTGDSGGESETPDRLWAVGAPGVDLDGLTGTGWTYTFE